MCCIGRLKIMLHNFSKNKSRIIDVELEIFETFFFCEKLNF